MEEEIEKEINHIENLIYKIKTSVPNQFSVNDLPILVRKEYNRVVNTTNDNKLYSRNLKLVINSELDKFANSRKNPRNRLKELIEFRETIIMIMERKISDLKQG